MWDVEGTRYLDLVQSYGAVILGHAHPALVRTVAEQAGRLMHVSNYFYNDQNVRLASELCAATGITDELLADLESYGLLAAAPVGGVPSYDAEGQMVARAAARYVELGVEPRHLRMYKVAAEREAGFVEQLIMPLLKQRNPQARREAVELVEELSELGHDLRSALLRSNLRRHLDQA